MRNVDDSDSCCYRCGSLLIGSYGRVTRNGVGVILCFDPKGVTCYDWYLLESDGGTF